MSDLHDNPIKAEKRKKLHALKEKGINPYPYSFDQNVHVEKLIQDYSNLTAGEKKTETNDDCLLDEEEYKEKTIKTKDSFYQTEYCVGLSPGSTH